MRPETASPRPPRPHAPPAIDRGLRDRGLVPIARALVRLGYFRFEVVGAEHLPRDGRAVYALNHAGWFPLDAFFAGLAVEQALGPDRTPFFAAHDSALAAPLLGSLLRRAGAVPASWLRRPERLPREIGAWGVFPEGVAGNTKPFWRAYRMRPWNRGFVRVAAALDLPVVPVAVLGGEECLPVAWTVRQLERWIGASLGLPVSPVPLPARWTVVFHERVRVPGGRALMRDADAADAFAARLREKVQATLDAHAAGRPLARLSSLVEAAGRSPILAHRPGRAIPGPPAPPLSPGEPRGSGDVSRAGAGHARSRPRSPTRHPESGDRAAREPAAAPQ